MCTQSPRPPSPSLHTAISTFKNSQAQKFAVVHHRHACKSSAIELPVYALAGGEEHESESFRSVVFPEAEVDLEGERVDDAEALLLVGFVDFPVVCGVKLVDGDEDKGKKLVGMRLSLQDTHIVFVRLLRNRLHNITNREVNCPRESRQG